MEMQQKTTVERVLHYIGRKLRKDADGNEVISRHHAELAARMAFEGGRQSVVDNIPELEWKEALSDGETYWLAKPMGAYTWFHLCSMNIKCSIVIIILHAQSPFRQPSKWPMRITNNESNKH